MTLTWNCEYLLSQMQFCDKTTDTLYMYISCMTFLTIKASSCGCTRAVHDIAELLLTPYFIYPQSNEKQNAWKIEHYICAF